MPFEPEIRTKSFYFYMNILFQVSLEMMETMVRAHKGPLSEVMIKTGFPAAVHCTLHTDDNAAMQNGGECLRAFLSVALEQVMAWHDEQGWCSSSEMKN